MTESSNTKSPDRSTPNGKIHFQDRFEELAKDFPFNLAPGANDKRMVGVVLAPASHGGTDPTPSGTPESLTATSDEDEIRSIVQQWETLHPDEIADKWKDVLTDPFIGLGPGWIKAVDDQFIADWQVSDEYKELREKFLPHSPRRTEISDVKIAFVGDSMASVTYRAEEETQDNRGVGNGAALLMKTGAGWRIAAVARFDKLVGNGDSTEGSGDSADSA